MKVLSSSQIKDLDRLTIKEEHISSWDLMERAASTIVAYLNNNYPQKEFYIFCGKGNNGGDGLAITRLLNASLHKTKTFLLSTNLSPDADKNARLLKGQDNVEILTNITSQLKNIPKDVIIIDALFGTGLNRALDGLSAELVAYINKLSNNIISVDLPSGLMTDKSPSEDAPIIKATLTLSFQTPTLTFFLPDCYQYVGEWILLDIGLSKNGLNSSETNIYYSDKNLVQHILKPRNKFSHKGNFGHALLIAGSYGKIGAAILASRACLKTGVGLLTTHIPHCGYQVLQTAIPEAMINTDRSEMYFTKTPSLDAFTAIGIGPGLNTKTDSIKAFSLLLEKSNVPMVIDADALNILALKPNLLHKLNRNTILTPHPGEFKRLVGTWNSDTEKITKLKDFCNKYKLITILKGAHTIICLPDSTLYFNSTGNAGMASAGSGDVLTGIILSLLSQAYPPYKAAIMGVYLHGLAGDLALDKESQESLIASNIITNLANAFKTIG